MKAWTQQAIIQGMTVPVSLALSTKHRTNFYCVREPSHINKAKEPTACLMRVDKGKHYCIM
jgi:hypothetical protein